MKKLVVGLGNPGIKYKNSKHNIGFMAIDHYAKNNQLSMKVKTSFNAEIAEKGDLILVKPLTFMNLSGIAVRKIIDFYQIDIDQILVIYDDVDLPFGKLRLRYQGGAGGHNGIKSIIEHLGSQKFNRIRFGIDKSDKMDMKDYVLSKFSKVELKELEDILIDIDRVIDDFKEDISFNDIMTKYN